MDITAAGSSDYGVYIIILYIKYVLYNIFVGDHGTLLSIHTSVESQLSMQG